MQQSFIMVCTLMIRARIAQDMFTGKVQKAEAVRKKCCFLVFPNKVTDKIIHWGWRDGERVLEELEKIWESLRKMEKGADQSQVQEATVNPEPGWGWRPQVCCCLNLCGCRNFTISTQLLEGDKSKIKQNKATAALIQHHILLDDYSKGLWEWVVARNVKMLAKSGLDFCHEAQDWEEKPGEKVLYGMEVPWSKNKGSRIGVMRALMRLKVVVTCKDIRQLFQPMKVYRVAVVAAGKRSFR